MSRKQPTFKPYYQNQLMAFPPTFDELIPKDHPVRIVDQVINSINIEGLIKKYHQTGASSYHPMMLLKVLIYGYISNIYSSRKLSVACKEHIPFMWLSGMSKPDHNTINRFRGVRLKDSLREIFSQVVLLLNEEGLLSIDEVFTEGTKVEANAGKFTFVWKKSIQSNKLKMQQQLKDIWDYASSMAKQEDDELPPEPPTNKELNKENLEATIERINGVLGSTKKVDKKQRAKLLYIKKNFVNNLDKYTQQEDILGERNSYSKTDPDATFMRMKDDYMQNGQLKPGYNIQISTSNQYIVNYSIHPDATDTGTLKPHLEQHIEVFGQAPKTLVADAGYGSQENYELMETLGTKAYVKYGMFDKQQQEKEDRKKPFTSDKLYYNKELNLVICPMGQQMNYIGDIKRKTKKGYLQSYSRYQAKDCSSCPLNGACHKASGNRVAELNHQLMDYRIKAHQLLNSEQGIQKRKKRCWDVESVFGNIKQNHRFRRFMLKGKEKVEIEWGLLAIAQNLRKKAA